MIKVVTYENEKDVSFMDVFLYSLNILFPKNNSINFVSWCLTKRWIY